MMKSRDNFSIEVYDTKTAVLLDEITEVLNELILKIDPIREFKSSGPVGLHDTTDFTFFDDNENRVDRAIQALIQALQHNFTIKIHLITNGGNIVKTYSMEKCHIIEVGQVDGLCYEENTELLKRVSISYPHLGMELLV